MQPSCMIQRQRRLIAVFNTIDRLYGMLPLVTVRRARVGDVRRIKELVDCYAGAVLLTKQLVTLYEDVQEFWVAERDSVTSAARGECEGVATDSGYLA